MAAGVALGKQPFCGELAPALLEQRHQRADAGRLQRLDDDLVLRRVRIARHPAGGDDFKAFLGLEAQLREHTAPDHGVDPGLVVLEAEIAVTGGMRAAIARDLATQAHEPEAVLERPLDGVGQLRNGQLRTVSGAGFSGGDRVCHES